VQETRGNRRCDWCEGHPLYVEYHDREWGVPEFDGERLFAKLLLDGFQAGLSWLTILKKRDGYYRAFDGLNPSKVARYDDARVRELLLDSRIVRNRLKVEAAIRNSRAYLDLRERGVDFAGLLWGFVDGKTMLNRWRDLREIPAETVESAAMSRALREAGFRFVGPTICYAFMQAVGMVNDHLLHCFRHAELVEAAGARQSGSN
jgi:DNA-3-methyladenine glycosylase I